MKRWEMAILVGFLCSVITCSAAPFAQRCDTVRQETMRLHILANSDSKEDQALKLLVRDALLEQVGVVFAQAEDEEEAVALAEANLGSVAETARRTLRENGCDAPVEAQVVRDMYFATRQYGGVVMPAGRYDAVRVLIGEAKGHNWWCVMFPPLCLPAAEPRGEAAGEAEAALLPAKPEYQVKFAVVELYEKLRDKLQNRKGNTEQVLSASAT